MSTTLFELKPSYIGDLFANVFTSDHLLKGQKELANVIGTILKDEEIKYGIKDKSKSIFYYGTEDNNYIEDTDCMLLLSIFVPILKEQMATFRYCMMSSSVSNKEQAWKGFLDNLSIIENGSVFKNQLRTIVPVIKQKVMVEIDPSDVIQQKIATCIEKYSVLKDKIKQINPHDVYTEKMEECVPRTIGGVSLGKLYPFYHQYQETGVYKIPVVLRPIIEQFPEIEAEWEAYMKHGLYKGKNIMTEEDI